MADNSNDLAATPLRAVLKRETRDLHDRLDASFASATLAGERDYTEFLSVQSAARTGIEAWVASQPPGTVALPPVAGLIAADLRALRAPVPPAQPFAFPNDADPIGVAWALGGSALGNKAMLARRRRAGASHAESFLSDPRTAVYFRALLPRLELMVAAHEAAAAVKGARAVFETFLSAMRRNALQAAA